MNLSLLHFTQITAHTSEVVRRSKSVVVIVKPHLSSDSDGPHYEQYCKQQLMLHKPFQQVLTLLTVYDTFIEAYTDYTRTNETASSLETDIQQLNTQPSVTDDQDDNEDDNDMLHQNTEEWMLLCRARLNVESPTDGEERHDWNASAQRYPNLTELPSFISSKDSAYITALTLLMPTN